MSAVRSILLSGDWRAGLVICAATAGRAQVRKTPASVAAKPEKIAPYERELMEILVRWPPAIATISASIAAADFASEPCRRSA